MPPAMMPVARPATAAHASRDAIEKPRPPRTRAATARATTSAIATTVNRSSIAERPLTWPIRSIGSTRMCRHANGKSVAAATEITISPSTARHPSLASGRSSIIYGPYAMFASDCNARAQVRGCASSTNMSTITRRSFLYGSSALAVGALTSCKRKRPRRTAPSARYASHVQVVPHQDDDLLFMNPDLQIAIASGAPVTTIYLTSGEADAENPKLLASYASQREAGARE